MTAKNISPHSTNRLGNGILYLKGGDLTAELSEFKKKSTLWQIKNFFNEPYFETKVIVYLPV